MRTRLKMTVMCVLVLCALGLSIKAAGGINSAAEELEMQLEAAHTEKSEAQFVIRSLGGYLAVYGRDCAEPLTVTDIELSSLPDADREAIAEGLPVRDRTELLTLLEDFGS